MLAPPRQFEVVAEFTIAESHPSLQGHFPARPIVPGAVLLDKICQAASEHNGYPVQQLRLTNVKFMHPVEPDLVLMIAFSATTTELSFRCTDRHNQIYVSGNIRHDE